MSVPAAPEKRPTTVTFAGFVAGCADERAIATEVWLDGVVSAPWASKEIMKIAAFLSKLAAECSTAPLFLKDIESRYNIQQGEISMSLTLMTTFRVLDGFEADRGQIVVRLRLGMLQLIRVKTELARLIAVRAPAVEAAALAAAADEMRRVLAEDASETVASDIAA